MRAYKQVSVDSEPKFAKNSAFNKNFGSAAGQVAQGNDARLSDARTPKTHSHVVSQITDFNPDDYVGLSGNESINGVKTFKSDIIVQGDAYVEGAFNAVSSNDVNIGDRIITLNSEISATTTPTLDAGIEIARGSQAKAQLLWDEGLDQWLAGIQGTLKALATESFVSQQITTREPAFSKSNAFNKSFGSSSGTVTQGNDSRLSDARTPKAHTHAISNITSLQTTLDAKEPVFSKSNAFNKSFGSTSGTVTQGNDSRLSDARTPKAHTHSISNITSLQTTLNAKEPTFDKNTAFNKSFGKTAGTVTQGNDSRLTDARTPIDHTHFISDVTNLQSSLDAKANSSHNHSINEVVNLQSSLNQKADLSGCEFTGSVDILAPFAKLTLESTNTDTTSLDFFDAGKRSFYFNVQDDNMDMQKIARPSGSNSFQYISARLEFVDKSEPSANYQGYIESYTPIIGVEGDSDDHLTTRRFVTDELEGKAALSHTHSISNITSLQTALNAKEPVFSKSNAFNKSFGSTSGTVTQGNDSRLSDARTPKAHTHSIANITSLQTTLDAKRDKDDGAFDDNIQVENDNPYITVDSTDSGNAHMQWQNQNVRTALMYASATNLFIRKYRADPQHVSAELRFIDNLGSTGHYQGYIISRTRIQGVEGSSDSDLTTRGYVNDELDKKVSNSADEDIDGAKTFTANETRFDTASGDCTIVVDSGTGTNDDSNVDLKRGNTLVSQWAADGNTASLSRYENGNLQSRITFGDTYVDFRALDNTTHLQFTRFTSGSYNVNKLSIHAPGASNESGAQAGTTELEFDSHGIHGAKQVRLASKPHMESSYTLRLPEKPPTAVGQQLTVESISGQVIGMKWA